MRCRLPCISSAVKTSGRIRGIGQYIPCTGKPRTSRASSLPRRRRTQVYDKATYRGCSWSPYLSPRDHGCEVMEGTWSNLRGHGLSLSNARAVPSQVVCDKAVEHCNDCCDHATCSDSGKQKMKSWRSASIHCRVLSPLTACQISFM
jgi:hypothetical protein